MGAAALPACRGSVYLLAGNAWRGTSEYLYAGQFHADRDVLCHSSAGTVYAALTKENKASQELCAVYAAVACGNLYQQHTGSMAGFAFDRSIPAALLSKAEAAFGASVHGGDSAGRHLYGFTCMAGTHP